LLNNNSFSSLTYSVVPKRYLLLHLNIRNLTTQNVS